MKKKMTAVIALTMAIILAISGGAAVAGAAEAQSTVLTECGGNCDTCPSIVIPGLFQCESFIYDENGEKAKNSAGDVYEAPFFLESTADIVKLALKKAVLPLLSLIFTQRDIGNACANSLGAVLGEVLLGRVKPDSNGKLPENVRATKYETSVAGMNEHDRAYVLNAIPLQAYIDKSNADHLYFYSYYSFNNIITLGDELYELIEKVKRETGHDKVNIVPISQGGTIANILLENHPDVVNSLNRIVYVVPALDGALTIGDIYSYGLLDDDEALYSYMFPKLIGEDDALGYLVNLIIRILPKDELNNVLDAAVDTLVEDYLEHCTCIWALVPSAQYRQCADKYLSDPEDAEIRRQTDIYYNAQLNSKANITRAIEAGVKVFDIVDYNDYLYPIVDSWQSVNSDGIIQLDSTSLGATSFGTDVELPDDYRPVNPVCTNPDHNHIDPHRIVDASTGLLPETTFYFYNQNHERTASNDVIMKLAVELMVNNDFTSVHSYPDKFPQFNVGRNSKGFINDLKAMKEYDKSGLTQEDRTELEAAIAQGEAVINNTAVDLEAYDAATERFYKIRNKVLYGEPEQPSLGDSISELFSTFAFNFIKGLSDMVYKTLGARGI